MMFYVYRSIWSSRWRWSFLAPNGKTIAKSSEGYKDFSDCIKSIMTLKDVSAETGIKIES